jgi:uncharacterized protein (TIGR02646 family)
MIAITRSPTLPSSLRRYQTKWTNELCAERREYYRKLRSPDVTQGLAPAPTKPRAPSKRYASEPVKRALQASFGDWCGYCGDVLGASSFPRADHFRPQAIYPALAYEWTNLIQACEICNERKKDKFELTNGTHPVENERSPCAPRVGEVNALVDPCVDNPDEHFAWDGHDLRPLTPRGDVTCRTMDLCREALVDQRQGEMDAFRVLLRTYQLGLQTGVSAAELAQTRASLAKLLGPAGRFPAMKRAALAGAGLSLRDFIP